MPHTKKKSEFCEIFVNQRRLKAATKELSVWDLEAAQEKLANVIAQRRKEDDIQLKRERERNARIEQFRHLLDAEGLTIDDLLGADPVQKPKQRAALPPKYRVTDKDGKVVTWSGRGRQPKAIKEALKQGRSLEDLEIS